LYIFADHSEIEKPKAWRITFFGKGTEMILVHKDGLGIITASCSTLLKHPVQRFRIEIKEVAEQMQPDSNYAKRHGAWPHWAISYIRIREYRIRLFGRGFFSHEV